MSWWMAAAGAGLALGAAGSAHCALMCGPLVVAVEPRATGGRSASARFAAARHRAAYHLGRVLMYVALGLIVGAGAEAASSRGLGRGLAIAAALSAVLIVVAQRSGRVTGASFPGRWVARLMSRVGQWLQTHPVAGPFAFGAASGLLPCGMVYAGLASAAAFGSVAAAGAFMAGLALAPVPVLWLVAAASGRVPLVLPAPWRRHLARLAPVGALVLAALLAFRAAPARPASHDTTDATPHAHMHHQP